MADVTAPFGFPYPENTDLVRDGAQDIEALAEGVNDQLALGYLYVGTRYYTSSGTFAKADPFGDSSFDGAKMRAIRVRMVGGGGGSGGVATTGAGQFNASGGGGGGGYAEAFVTDIAGLSASVTVTRGAGGAAGAAGFNSGSTGGQSSFDSIVGNGGGGGEGMPAKSAFGTSQPGGGGTPSGGDFNVGGNSGGAGLAVSNEAFGNYGGFGASSVLGGGRASARVAATGGVNGSAGQPHGGGASGCANLENTTQRAGAAGGNGIVIIDVFA